MVMHGLARDWQMARKKVSTTVYITPEQNARLKILHDRTKVPVAEYIRENEKEPEPKFRKRRQRKDE